MRVPFSRTWVPTVLCVTFLGCGASEEKVQDKFEDFLSSRRDCSTDDDCVVQSFDCPLGCYQVFNGDYEDEVQEEAERLIRKYERGGRSCEYSCSEAAEAVCSAGECTTE